VRISKGQGGEHVVAAIEDRGQQAVRADVTSNAQTRTGISSNDNRVVRLRITTPRTQHPTLTAHDDKNGTWTRYRPRAAHTRYTRRRGGTCHLVRRVARARGPSHTAQTRARPAQRREGGVNHLYELGLYVEVEVVSRWSRTNAVGSVRALYLMLRAGARGTRRDNSVLYFRSIRPFRQWTRSSLAPVQGTAGQAAQYKQVAYRRRNSRKLPWNARC